jgi:hypothetical protein
MGVSPEGRVQPRERAPNQGMDIIETRNNPQTLTREAWNVNVNQIHFSMIAH